MTSRRDVTGMIYVGKEIILEWIRMALLSYLQVGKFP